MPASLAPVVLFVYARVQKVNLTVQSLLANPQAPQTDLFVFSDGPRNKETEPAVSAVRRYIRTIEGFRSVRIFESVCNKGLATSIVSGTTQVLLEYGRAIVVEDDLLTTPDFLAFMNGALDFYRDDPRIWSISGFSPPISYPNAYQASVYALERAHCWGWATWLDRWVTVDWDLRDYSGFIQNPLKVKRFCLCGNDLLRQLRYNISGQRHTWYVRWCYNQYRQSKLCIFPVRTKVINNGLDGSGEHSKASDASFFSGQSMVPACFDFIRDIQPDARIRKRFKRFYDDKILLFMLNGARKRLGALTCSFHQDRTVKEKN